MNKLLGSNSQCNVFSIEKKSCLLDSLLICLPTYCRYRGLLLDMQETVSAGGGCPDKHAETGMPELRMGFSACLTSAFLSLCQRLLVCVCVLGLSVLETRKSRSQPL